MPIELWHEVARQVYDFMAHLLQLGWHLVSAIARAVLRWPEVGETAIVELGGLAIQAFTAGAAFNTLSGPAMLPPESIPDVPPGEGMWYYTGYFEDLSGARQWFDITSDHQLSADEFARRARELRDAALGMDTNVATVGGDKFYRGAGELVEEESLIEPVVTRIERR